MNQYAARVVLQFVPTLFLASVVVFSFIHVIPGDPAHVLLGPQANQEQIEALQRSMGLDEPLWVQYGIWLRNVLSGDLGTSINGYPVSELLITKLAVTAELSLGALIIGAGIGVPLGVVAAARNESWIDRAANFYFALAMGVPHFWLGVLLILVFSLYLGWLPPSGYASIFDDPIESLKFLLLPAVTLGGWTSAVIARFLRQSVLDVLNQDYIRTANAKGLAERVVLRRHAMKNALIPAVTMMGIEIGALLSGAVIVEVIFSYPGLGRLLVNSILARDYAVVQGTILLITFLFLAINLLTDLTYGLLDPRVRHQ